MNKHRQSVRIPAQARSMPTLSARNRSCTRVSHRRSLQAELLEPRTMLAGDVSGNVFADYNGDGIRQGGEPGIHGATVFIDVNNNGNLDGGDIQKQTDSAGNYQFDQVGSGSASIRIVIDSGTLTSPQILEPLASTTSETTTPEFPGCDLTNSCPTKEPRDIVFADVNGDQLKDTILVQAFPSNQLAVALNGGVGDPPLISVGSEPTSIASGFFNSGNHEDIVVANNADDTLSVMFDFNGATFDSTSSDYFAATPLSVLTDDFDTDGDVDILSLSTVNGTETLFRNDGLGIFVPDVPIPLTNRPPTDFGFQSEDLGDFNNDGITDKAMIVSETINSIQSFFVDIFLGDGNGSFSFSTRVTPLAGDPGRDLATVDAIQVGDIDGDSDADFVIAFAFDQFGAPEYGVEAYRNDGLVFQPQGLLYNEFTDVFGYAPTVVLEMDDLNLDGAADIAFASPSAKQSDLTIITSNVIDEHRVLVENTDIDSLDFGVLIPISVANLNDSGPGSLRDAISIANTHAGPNEIQLDIPGAGPHIIQLLTPLPAITEPLVIDGTADSDYAGTPVIQLDGAGAIVNGLVVNSSDTTIRGLSVTGFSNSGIRVNAPGGATIEQNYLGLDPSGNADGNYFGLRIQSSPNNIVDNNVISGNNRAGLFVTGLGADNLVTNNLIGTDPTGTQARPNATDGITNFAPSTQIGLPGQGNTISGNARWGVVSSFADRNIILQGNQIGTDITGLNSLPNVIGVYLQNNDNVIGGSNSTGNVISGNSAYGLGIGFTTGNNNIVRGNVIGTDATGSTAIANSLYGVRITQGSNNQIGGDGAHDGNIISGNGTGVLIVFPDATGNTIVGNQIGTDTTGDTAIPNLVDGVRLVRGARNNVIRNNQLAGNGGRAVTTDGATTINNDVLFNLIGTNAAGTGPLHNGAPDGLRLKAPGGRIESNVISAPQIGLFAFRDATNLEIVDNYFGTDETETSTTLGMDIGVKIILGSQDNLIQGNTITNTNTGISIGNGTGNRITANSIYGNAVIGIDLGGNGITPNDTNDADSGANNLQNAAVLTQADLAGNLLTVRYIVDSIDANSNYSLSIEFFLSDGNGQGQQLIGSDLYLSAEQQSNKTVVLDVAGLGVTSGDKLVATVTDQLGNTSEFGLEFAIA